jgi:hypothetical protein
VFKPRAFSFILSAEKALFLGYIDAPHDVLDDYVQISALGFVPISLASHRMEVCMTYNIAFTPERMWGLFSDAERRESQKSSPQPRARMRRHGR